MAYSWFSHLVFTTSCENSDEEIDVANNLALPPYESMVIDFSDFIDDSNSGKSAALMYDDKAPMAIGFFHELL